MVNVMPKIVFCSRLHPRKRPLAFFNLAEEASENGFLAEFEIYGSDAGELRHIKERIKTKRNETKIVYKGSLAPAEVMEVLWRSDLLVLPSDNEPFPMIVLEALAVGTPVLIMSSCGLASQLKTQYPSMIIDNDEEMFLACKNLVNIPTIEKRRILHDFCIEIFGIKSVVDKLEKCYTKIAVQK